MSEEKIPNKGPKRHAGDQCRQVRLPLDGFFCEPHTIDRTHAPSTIGAPGVVETKIFTAKWTFFYAMYGTIGGRLLGHDGFLVLYRASPTAP
jgi:hypothetical protein